jgi:hypothetical protein
MLLMLLYFLVEVTDKKVSSKVLRYYSHNRVRRV